MPPQVWMGHPDDPWPKASPEPLVRPERWSLNGSAVAAGPSTCGDVDRRRHHIGTGEPGQGVDGPLLCLVISQSPAPPPYQALRPWLRQKVF
ncbi:hypothetical protein KXV85_003614, partial [Aspergillus fumigatus]